MKLLECLAILNFTLQQLKVGQRVPVPVSVFNNLKSVIIPINKKLEEVTDDACRFALKQLTEAISLVDIPVGSMYLTDTSKEVLVEGVVNLKEAVAMQAFEYFKWNDFDPTDQIIPIMQDVVEVAAKKGVI